MKKFLSVIFLFVTFSIGVSAQPEYPELKNYATDLTGTLSSSQINQFNRELKKFEDATSSQIVFLLINSLDGYPVEMYANELAEKNKIGTKANDNGVLFIVSLRDRKMRIEVGYGLEGALPDALASSILRNEVKPYFKRDMYYEGIAAGLVAIMKATVGEYTREQREDNSEEKGKGISGYFFLIILFLIIRLFGRGGRGGGIGSAILLGGMLGGMGGRSSGGGGGFGGFSGGGGGFGGGGASGSW